jgi:amidophosphoribosyltransferase
MAHNGNMTNYHRLRQRLSERSVYLLSTCDVEPVLCIFADALMARRRRNHTADDVVAALRDTFAVVDGAFTVVMALEVDGEPTLVCFRDPQGIRPGVWGKRGDARMVASESVALDALDFEFGGHIPPGEVMLFRAGQPPEVRSVDCRGDSPCVFESIYFSRPDSRDRETTVYQRRLDLGTALAREWQNKGFTADRVIAVPDTSRPAAIAFGEELGIPCREGFIKNRYSGRTFIMGSQASRQSALRLKLNLIQAEFKNQNVVIIDDSIVRGNTVRRLLDLVWAQGPKSVHFAIHSPPVLNPCYYGIDMSTRDELAAPGYLDAAPPIGGMDAPAQRAMEEAWAKDLGIDSLTFLSVQGMDSAFPKSRCAACFDGIYPLPIPKGQRDSIANDRICNRPST